MHKKITRFLFATSLVVGFSLALPTATLAATDEDSYLGDDGKMEVQVDRAKKTEAEKAADKDTQKTAAEEEQLNLFSKENEARDAEIKAYEDKKLKDLKASLFADEDTKVDTSKATRATLFKENISAAQTNATNENETAKESKTIWWVLGGIAVLICGLLYTLVRKVWE
ncbi:type VII secretion protein EssA [Listeria booriae]|uniref:Type VII secretion protein EssA n=1 Tax=Listeria booriae TaxID=1552123 RepID=A0A841XVN7_9LIST|nr:type VII secretion protein EssA [Listeria booriae]MBC1371359.1 type VII secretion protein EssA [Listeria booriae]